MEALSPPCAGSPGRFRAGYAKLLGAAVSVVVLSVMCRHLDLASLGEVLRGARPGILLGAVAMVAPVYLLTSIRLRLVAPSNEYLTLAESARLSVVATALNTFMPAKSGDVVKGYFLHRRGGLPLGQSMGAIVADRLCDLFGISTWVILGVSVTYARSFVAAEATSTLHTAALVIVCAGAVPTLLVLRPAILAHGIDLVLRHAPSRVRGRLAVLERLGAAWMGLHGDNHPRRKWIVLVTLVLWFLHLTQVWLFVLAVGAPVSLIGSLLPSVLVLAAGMVPLTFAGIGPREAALVAVYSGHMSTAAAVSVGVFMTSRFLVPTLCALPLLPRYADALTGGRAPTASTSSRPAQHSE